MAVSRDFSELLFSYGTLQLEAVQLATFGRRLSGTRDALVGFELAPFRIDDEKVVAISGQAVHTMAKFTGVISNIVSGLVFTISRDELEKADSYEVSAFKRVALTLQSGVRAWTYVDAEYMPSSWSGVTK